MTSNPPKIFEPTDDSHKFCHCDTRWPVKVIARVSLDPVWAQPPWLFVTTSFIDQIFHPSFRYTIFLHGDRTIFIYFRLVTTSPVASNNDTQYLIPSNSDLLDRDRPLLDFDADWPGTSSVAVNSQLVLSHDPSAGLILLGSTYFLMKTPFPYSIAHHVDRSAKYMNEGNFPEYHATWIKIIHAFPAIYTNCTRPAQGRNQNSLNSILKHVESILTHL